MEMSEAKRPRHVKRRREMETEEKGKEETRRKETKVQGEGGKRSPNPDVQGEEDSNGPDATQQTDQLEVRTRQIDETKTHPRDLQFTSQSHPRPRKTRTLPVRTPSSTKQPTKIREGSGKGDIQLTLFGVDWTVLTTAFRNSSSVGKPSPSPIAPAFTLGN